MPGPGSIHPAGLQLQGRPPWPPPSTTWRRSTTSAPWRLPSLTRPPRRRRLKPPTSRRNPRCPCPASRPAANARAVPPNGTTGPERGPRQSIPGARRRHERPRSGWWPGYFACCSSRREPVAAVRDLPGSVAVLGDHADRRLRHLRRRPTPHAAGLRVGVGLPGPPARDPRRPHGDRGRVRGIPGGAQRRNAVRRPGAARVSRSAQPPVRSARR